MNNIPKIKKKVNAFLVGEEGKISKESILKLGVISIITSSIMFQTVHGGRYNHSNRWGESPPEFDADKVILTTGHGHGCSYRRSIGNWW